MHSAVTYQHRSEEATHPNRFPPPHHTPIPKPFQASHSIYTFPLSPSRTKPRVFILYLESWLSILHQHLKVRLVPLAGLGTRLERILHATEAVVALGARIARAIALTTGLDPDKAVDKAAARVGGGPDAKASTVDIAPVAPFAAQTGDGVAARVDNGLAGHAFVPELGREELDVELLVLRLVVLGVAGGGELAGCLVPGVPAGDVGGDAADGLGAAGVLVHGCEFFGTGLCWEGGAVVSEGC
ncbi:hypothetical protein J1614_005390 [Plenodomus biglobosus]|nr:hypothetical protein J1614_005390 [Plenodomus biglobosus]